MNIKEYAGYGPSLVRLAIAALFLNAGINKLMKPDGIIGLLTSQGFPLPMFLGWVVLLSEIIFGVCVLVGWKVKYTAWPLVVIMLIAGFAVVGISSQSATSFIFHMVAAASLISLALTGPGKLAVSKE